MANRGQPFDDKSDLPKLARAAQLSLGLDPSTGSGPDGSDAVRRILGAVTTIANGLAELRNRGLGTGHGPEPHVWVSAPGTRTSRSTRRSPGASSCSTPSPTPRPPGTRLTRKRRPNEDHENNQIRSVTKPTPIRDAARLGARRRRGSSEGARAAGSAAPRARAWRRWGSRSVVGLCPGGRTQCSPGRGRSEEGRSPGWRRD